MNLSALLSYDLFSYKKKPAPAISHKEEAKPDTIDKLIFALLASKWIDIPTNITNLDPGKNYKFPIRDTHYMIHCYCWYNDIDISVSRKWDFIIVDSSTRDNIHILIIDTIKYNIDTKQRIEELERMSIDNAIIEEDYLLYFIKQNNNDEFKPLFDKLWELESHRLASESIIKDLRSNYIL